MPVRSRRLALSPFAGLLPVTIYTVPAGRTAVVRSALILNTAANANVAELHIGGVECWRGSVPGSGTVAVPDDLIGNPGDVFEAHWQTVGGVGTVGLYGSLLSGPPE